MLGGEQYLSAVLFFGALLGLMDDEGAGDYRGSFQNLRKLKAREVRKYGLHKEKQAFGLPGDADLHVDMLSGDIYFRVNEPGAPYELLTTEPLLSKKK